MHWTHTIPRYLPLLINRYIGRVDFGGGGAKRRWIMPVLIL
jgi:hypothetical protein